MWVIPQFLKTGKGYEKAIHRNINTKSKGKYHNMIISAHILWCKSGQKLRSLIISRLWSLLLHTKRDYDFFQTPGLGQKIAQWAWNSLTLVKKLPITTGEDTINLKGFLMTKNRNFCENYKEYKELKHFKTT